MREENRSRRYLSDYRSKILRPPNCLSKTSETVAVSKEKKQILVNVAFKKVCDNEKQTNGGRIELSHL